MPEIAAGKGGIQVFSQFFLRALQESMPDARFDVFSKNDSAPPVKYPGAAPERFHFSGLWPARPRTAAFSARLVAAGLMKRPDLVITTHVNFAPAAQWLHLALGIPYVAVAHGVDVWGRAGEPLRRSLKSAAKVLAVSRYTRERMLSELALEPERVGVLPNTFDPEIFQPGPKPRYLLKRHGIEAEDLVILTVCRLANAERYKGYDQLLEVLPSVLRAVPRARYVIAGRGPDRPRVEAIVRRLGLSERVIFAGYVPDYELPDYYNLCDVFAMPSKGEGFGIVFLEALASGKPILAGNVDGSVDALLGGELGVMVDPDNEGQLRDALIQMLERRHPLDILWEPERLRARAIESFGFSRFVKTVAWHLSGLGFEAGVAKAPPVTATI